MPAGSTWLRAEWAARDRVGSRRELGWADQKGLEPKPEATGSIISATCRLRLRTEQNWRQRPARSLPIREEQGLVSPRAGLTPVKSCPVLASEGSKLESCSCAWD